MAAQERVFAFLSRKYKYKISGHCVMTLLFSFAGVGDAGGMPRDRVTAHMNSVLELKEAVRHYSYARIILYGD
jgi:hypothetical protein